MNCNCDKPFYRFLLFYVQVKELFIKRNKLILTINFALTGIIISKSKI